MSKIAIITGAAGLIGGKAVRFFSAKGFQCVGIDTNMREQFFGDDTSTDQNRQRLKKVLSYRCTPS